MELNLFDWLFVAFLTLGEPILGILMHRRVTRRVDAGIPGARIRAYRNTLLTTWGVLAIALVVWLTAGRGLAGLGLGLSLGTGWWIGVALTAIISVLLVMQWLSLRGNEDKLREASAGLDSLRALLPHTDHEQRWFGAVSVSAGICEEIVYRGALMGLLAAVLGTWPAVLISSLIFGLAHLYQGPRGAAKTVVVGLVMAGLTVLTGSLWAPIVLHVVIDVTSGLIAQRAVGVSPGAVEEVGAPA